MNNNIYKELAKALEKGINTKDAEIEWKDGDIAYKKGLYTIEYYKKFFTVYKEGWGPVLNKAFKNLKQAKAYVDKFNEIDEQGGPKSHIRASDAKTKDESISKQNLKRVSEASKVSVDKIEININSKGITEYFHKENGGLIGTWNPKTGKIEIKNWVRDSNTSDTWG